MFSVAFMNAMTKEKVLRKSTFIKSFRIQSVKHEKLVWHRHMMWVWLEIISNLTPWEEICDLKLNEIWNEDFLYNRWRYLDTGILFWRLPIGWRFYRNPHFCLRILNIGAVENKVDTWVISSWTEFWTFFNRFFQ